MTVSVFGTVDPVADGRPDAELLVLGPSLGTTTALWQQTIERLSATHRVLRFDLPGHGVSKPVTDHFDVADIADAVIALVDSIGGGSFHYAGISLGGAVGLELALRHPSRLESLTVICSAAQIGAAEGWVTRAADVRAAGTASTVESSASRWFAPDFVERQPSVVAAALEELLRVDDESYALCCEALARFDVTDEVYRIAAPTLCVSGEFDLPTPSAQLADLADRIPGARHVTMTAVAHLPALERPEPLSTLLLDHLSSSEGAAAVDAAVTAEKTAMYRRGMTERRAVLGDAHVDRATASITPQTAAFQDFITRYAWGDVWSRPGLARRDRSLLTLASLVTGGHHDELAMHVRAALTNGLSRDEIAEAIQHTAIYAGVPAANSAFGVATRVFAEIDAHPPTGETA